MYFLDLLVWELSWSLYHPQNVPVSSLLRVLTHSHVTASTDGAFIMKLGYTAQNAYAEYLKHVRAVSKARLLT